MDNILQSIGFTANHCLVSDDIIPLLNTLHNDKTTYLSLLPNEIFNIIIQNLYINLEFNNLNKEKLKNLLDKYNDEYLLIFNKDFAIILKAYDYYNLEEYNEDESKVVSYYHVYACNGFFIIPSIYNLNISWMKYNYSMVEFVINIDEIVLYFYENYDYEHDFELYKKYNELIICFIKPDDIINKHAQLFHNLIMYEFTKK